MHLKMIIVVFLFSLLSKSLYADVIGSSFVDNLIAAQLIFEGEVVDIQYRQSHPPANPVPDRDDNGITHTFVTFKLHKVYKGSIQNLRSSSNDTVTLRFFGGEGPGDEYTLAHGIPLFDIGDQDLLMAVNNGSLICPLTRCKQGRFRFINRLVYNDDGQSVVSTTEAPVLYGPYNELFDVKHHRIGQSHWELITVKEPGEADTPAPSAFGTQYSIHNFRASVEHKLLELANAGLLPTPDPLINQHPDTPFVYQEASLSTPGTGLSQAHLTRLRFSDKGMAKLEALLIEFNGGDPRLPSWAKRFIKRHQIRQWQRLARIERQRDTQDHKQRRPD